MSDPAAGVGAEHLANTMLACNAWGVVVAGREGSGSGGAQPQWELAQPPLLSTVGPPGTVSYDTYLLYVLNPFQEPAPGASADDLAAVRVHNLAQRDKSKRLIRQFTDAGAPGSPFASVYRALLAALALPGGDGGRHFLLPAYFQLQRWLATCAVPYLVVIRTFGTDIPAVAREHNQWLAGEHATAGARPHANAVSLRLRCPFDLGIAVRSGPTSRETRLAVVAVAPPPAAPEGGGGPPTSPPTTREAAITRAVSRPSPPDFADVATVPTSGDAVPYLSYVVGYRDIAGWVTSRIPRAPGAGAMLAVRDDWEWWFSHNEAAAAGKLLPMDPDDTLVHHIFLDDNIGAACDTCRCLPPPPALAAAGVDASLFGEPADAATVAAARAASTDAGIVDARDVHTAAPLPFELMRDVHLARADPISAILNPNYYSALVSRMHAAWRARHGLPAHSLPATP